MSGHKKDDGALRAHKETSVVTEGAGTELLPTSGSADLVGRLGARLTRDRRGNLDPELGLKIGPGMYEEIAEAISFIERLQTELTQALTALERHLSTAAIGVEAGLDAHKRAIVAEAERDRLRTFMTEGSQQTIESEQAWKKRALVAEANVRHILGVALGLARKRIVYLGAIAGERHERANEKDFLPIIDRALAKPEGDAE